MIKRECFDPEISYAKAVQYNLHFNWRIQEQDPLWATVLLLFYRFAEAVDLHRLRGERVGPLEYVPTMTMIEYENDICFLPQLLANFIGQYSFHCFADFQTSIAVESGIEVSDALEMELNRDPLEIPDVVTVDVQYDEELVEWEGEYVIDKSWKFFGMAKVAEFGPEFMKLVHGVGHDIMRDIPHDFGHKLLLKCKTRKPFKGQRRLWEAGAWHYITLVKKGMIWYVKVGSNEITTPFTWTLCQQLLHIQVYALLHYATTL